MKRDRTEIWVHYIDYLLKHRLDLGHLILSRGPKI
jgi:hypothetical protein